MRKIKFKAWNKKDGKMYLLSTYRYGHGDTYEVFDLRGMSRAIPKVNVEILQYTGLSDREDKEICEGDVLERRLEISANDVSDTYYYVEPMDNGCFCCFNKYGGKMLLNVINSHSVIIGNVYQNPELAEQKLQDMQARLEDKQFNEL